MYQLLICFISAFFFFECLEILCAKHQAKRLDMLVRAVSLISGGSEARAGSPACAAEP